MNPQVEIDIEQHFPIQLSGNVNVIKGAPPGGTQDPDAPQIDQPEIFKFSWNATDPDPNDFKYDRKSCCMKIAGWYAKCPLLLRYALYSLTGTIILMVPGLVSYFLFVKDKGAYFVDMQEKEGGNGVFTIFSVPMFVWSV